MLTPEMLHGYQKRAVNHQCSTPHSMLWLDAGLGKQQPNNEPVLTPHGWVKMGDLRVGDYVIGSNGQPTQVIGVYPQGLQRVARVTFTDGSWTDAGYEHLWYVKNPKQHNRDSVGHVMTTQQIVDHGVRKDSGKNRENDTYWYIPMVQPVNFAPVDLPLDPYTLGVTLGDGSIAEKGYINLCTDKEILHAIDARLLREHATCDYVGYGYVSGAHHIMCDLGINGQRSWEKVVPSQYLLGNPEQRLALLQGLLDTDGSPIDKGGVEFSSTSENLTDAVVELAQSLGGVARKTGPRITTYQGGEGRPSWRVNVKLPGHLTPFRLRRKIDKWIRPSKYPPIRKIESIEPAGAAFSTCIKVAATDSLYVTRNYVVTHNTAVTLTTIAHLTRMGFLKGVLIVAPIRVIRMVWRQEALRWNHTGHLKFQMLTGTKEKRIHALMQPADIYLTNYEQLKWLSETLHQYFIKKGKPMPFNGVVWDEVSKMKNSTSDRVKAVRKVLPYLEWTTGLTGTPASNGLKDLHGQFLVVDKGQRLGEFKTHFKTMFFRKNGPYQEVAQDGAEEVMKKLISDITLEMSAAEYLQLPSVTFNDIVVELPELTRVKYDKMEKEMFVKLDSGAELETFNQASLMNKLLQFSNGAVYPIAGMPLWEPVHDEKLDALADLIDEANGQQVFVAYQFRSDAERIMKKFKALKPVNLTDCKSESALNDAMKRWADGDCPLMLAHPASAGHGIDGLQKNGHILVWFGLNWSLELYEQFNARINRQGQTKPVVCHRILVSDTFDMLQSEVLATKATTQAGLRTAVKNYRLQKGV